MRSLMHVTNGEATAFAMILKGHWATKWENYWKSAMRYGNVALWVTNTRKKRGKLETMERSIIP